MKDEEEIDNFISYIKMSILYWDKFEDYSSKRKLEGLAHSILAGLDGVAGSYSGDISKLNEASKYCMLHEQLYSKENIS